MKETAVSVISFLNNISIKRRVMFHTQISVASLFSANNTLAVQRFFGNIIKRPIYSIFSPSFSKMKRGMFAPHHQLKIFYSIIRLISVYMVDNLSFFELSAKMLLHDISMVLNSLFSFQNNSKITVFSHLRFMPFIVWVKNIARSVHLGIMVLATNSYFSCASGWFITKIAFLRDSFYKLSFTIRFVHDTMITEGKLYVK